MHMHHHDGEEQLGKVSFPISCAPASQQAFNRGVALMHSFQYEDAEAQFAEIAKSDPSCAMAHWGIALSYFHQIWERPQEPVLKRGHEQMLTAQKLGAKTDRSIGVLILADVDGKRVGSRSITLVPTDDQVGVKVGDQVTIRLIAAGATVEVGGKVKTAGWIGQMVSVQADTGSMHTAKVISSNLVEVRL